MAFSRERLDKAFQAGSNGPHHCTMAPMPSIWSRPASHDSCLCASGSSLAPCTPKHLVAPRRESAMCSDESRKMERAQGMFYDVAQLLQKQCRHRWRQLRALALAQVAHVAAVVVDATEKQSALCSRAPCVMAKHQAAGDAAHVTTAISMVAHTATGKPSTRPHDCRSQASTLGLLLLFREWCFR